MRITIKMEDGRPVLFFPDDVANPGRVVCYAAMGEHSEAARAYMRRLPAPVTPAERAACWDFLARYARSAAAGYPDVF